MFYTISIHAPTRGATRSRCMSGKTTQFQSTLPQGERLWKSTPPTTQKAFQSTLPQGERRESPADQAHPLEISIHAPTRGATKLICIRLHCFFISIHAPTRGATQSGGKSVIEYTKFQSTLPQGERRYNTRDKRVPVKFQSTLPQGERRSAGDH